MIFRKISYLIGFLNTICYFLDVPLNRAYFNQVKSTLLGWYKLKGLGSTLPMF